MAKKTGLLLIIILTLNSCASIFNGKRTKVKISADKDSKIIFDSDTISIDIKQTTIRPLRSKKPLKIRVLKDSLQQDFSFNKKLSNTVFLNIYNYGLGLAVDLFHNKGYRYKNNLHFVTDSLSNKIMLSNKKVTIVPKNKVFIYTSPLQAFDFFSIPMVTLGVEYFVKNNFSISAEYGGLVAKMKLSRHNITYLKEKASTYRFETKWYNGINLTENVHINEYLSLEIRNINSQYNDFIDYTDKNNSNLNNLKRDDFATRKRVTIINLKFGTLVPLGKRFYFDFYSGLGLRIKRFNHINLEFDKNIHQIYDDDFPSFEIREFKNYTRKTMPNLSLGCKFGINL